MDRTKYFADRGKDMRKRENRVEGRSQTWVVGEIWQLHEAVKQRIFLGEKNVKIAAALNCTAQQVSNIRNSPVIKNELAKMNGARDMDTIDLGKRIQTLAVRAHANLESIITDGKLSAAMGGKDASINLIARESNNMMDRAGWGAPKKLQMESVNVHLTTADIVDIKRRALEGGGLIAEIAASEQSEQNHRETISSCEQNHPVITEVLQAVAV